MKFTTVVFSLLFVFIASCKDKKAETNKTVAATDDPINAVLIAKTKPGEADTIKKSLKAYVKNKIGSAGFTIQYHSPAVRGRIIWGGLVPYGQVWVTGAHMATSLVADKDFYIGDKLLPAGKYALFTIPDKDEWTAIFNSNWSQHLADEYDEKEDMLRLKIKPDTLDYVQERLMYEINQMSQKEGEILMMWEKLKIKIPVRIAD